MKTRPLAILGAGNVGTALALLLARHGRPVNIFCIEPDVTENINRRHRNTTYLRGIRLPRNIRAFADPADALRGADLAIVAVPSGAVRNVALVAGPFLERDAAVAVISKGLDPTTLLPMAHTVQRHLPRAFRRRVCAIAGPAIAAELAQGTTAGVMVAGADAKTRHIIARLLASPTLKVATSDDMTGAGYAMAFKNVYAIALGMCDGLGAPMNTKALVLTLALEELSRLLEAAGGARDTAYTLAGIGDLAVSGFSPHGRNRTYGERLVGAKHHDPARLGLGTVEGMAAAPLALRFAKRLRVRAPLMQAVVDCLNASRPFERPFVRYLNHLHLV